MCRKHPGSAAVYGGIFIGKELVGLYQALYRKWRPKTFSDVVGQEHITATLQRQVAEGRLSHAYLFTGTRGTGKTTCAKILAKAVNCENPQNGDPCNVCPSCLGIDSGTFLDVMELDAASNNGVDNVRALRDEAIYSPAKVKKRVYIVDEVHMLTREAFNALLKILEEPPEHLMFILATTELHKVPPTVLSRCQRFAFRRILPRDITARLAYVAAQEKIDLRPDGAELLARLADGALRDALSLLDQCAAQGGAIDANAVLEPLGLAGSVQTAQLMEFVLRRDAKAALLMLNRLYAAGKDVGAVLGELSTLARDLLISVTAPEGGAALLSGGYDAQTMERLRKLTNAARLIRISTLLQRTLVDLQLSVNRRTDAELCLLRLCDEGLSGDLEALNARIARLEEQAAAGAWQARSAPEGISAAAVPVIAAQEKAGQKPAAQEPEEEEGPPPYGEPIAPAPEKKAVPAPEPVCSPAPPAKPDASEGDDRVFTRLLEDYKNRLEPMKRAFIGMASGSLSGDVLTVYCANEVQKDMLDDPGVIAVLSGVTAQAVGHAVSVRFVLGRPDGGKKHDKMQDLLRIGSKFDDSNDQ